MTVDDESAYVVEPDDEERRAEIQAQVDVLRLIGSAGITALLGAGVLLLWHFI